MNFESFQQSTLKFIWYIARQKPWIALSAFIMVLLAIITQSLVVQYIKFIVDAVNQGAPVNEIYLLTGLLILIIAFEITFWRLSGFLGSYWITSSKGFAYKTCFAYLVNHSQNYFNNRFVGTLNSKISNVAEGIDSLLPSLLWGFWSLFCQFIAFTIIISLASPWLGLIFAAFFILVALINYTISRPLIKFSKEKANSSSSLRGRMIDVLTNIHSVQQLARQEHERQGVQTFINLYQTLSLRSWRKAEWVLVWSNVFIAIMIASLMFSSIYLWSLGLVSLGDIAMLYTIITIVWGQLEFLGVNFNTFMERLGEVREGLQEIFQPYSIKNISEPLPCKINRGDIKFENVYFKYESDKESPQVFDNFNLHLRTGEKIGLVGESGAGKSTFVNLLMRFMDLDKGQIFIDGYNIAQIRQDELRHSIAYVPQEPILFHRTLKENISYGRPAANEADIIAAAKAAHAHDFIQTFPDGYDTLVGERGVKLSGGQKQRIAIARAMLKQAPILILDEATSSLDSKAEQHIQAALETLMKNRTTLVIAHRLSTLRQMDKIVVFENGQITESGTHDQLVAQQGKYAELWEHQSGGFIN